MEPERREVFAFVLKALCACVCCRGCAPRPAQPCAGCPRPPWLSHHSPACGLPYGAASPSPPTAAAWHGQARAPGTGQARPVAAKGGFAVPWPRTLGPAREVAALSGWALSAGGGGAGSCAGRRAGVAAVERGGCEPKSRRRQGWHVGTVPCSQTGATAEPSRGTREKERVGREPSAPTATLRRRREGEDCRALGRGAGKLTVLRPRAVRCRGHGHGVLAAGAGAAGGCHMGLGVRVRVGSLGEGAEGCRAEPRSSSTDAATCWSGSVSMLPAPWCRSNVRASSGHQCAGNAVGSQLHWHPCEGEGLRLGPQAPNLAGTRGRSQH